MTDTIRFSATHAHGVHHLRATPFFTDGGPGLRIHVRGEDTWEETICLWLEGELAGRVTEFADAINRVSEQVPA